ncbi:MAG TPA: lipopolysaccharide kinase InaA family protein [Phycisphaerae bacterium]|jgi:tRNA A-37 threonylcarbamoyl transferase component Bud32
MGWRWYVNPGFSELLTLNGLNTPEAVFDASGQVLNKRGLSSWRTRTRLELQSPRDERSVLFVKRYIRPPWRDQCQRILAGHGWRSTAGIEWHWIEALRAGGVACPQAVALAECLNGWREERSAILLAPVPGISLERWAADRTQRVARDMLLSLAQFVRRLHRAGFVHRDLYLCHIFFEAGAAEPFHLIDLQRVFRPRRWRRRRWIVKDLAALNYSAPAAVASRRDRLRFLRGYLDQPRLDRSSKRLARAVEAKTRQIAAHDRHRQRSRPAGGTAS